MTNPPNENKLFYISVYPDKITIRFCEPSIILYPIYLNNLHSTVNFSHTYSGILNRKISIKLLSIV